MLPILSARCRAPSQPLPILPSRIVPLERSSAPTPNASGGESPRVSAGIDGSARPLGADADGPAGLSEATRLVLDSPFPSVLVWGRARRAICNPGFIAIVGSANESGTSLVELWPSAPAPVAPAIETAFAGTAQRVDNLTIRRDGVATPTTFTFGFTPLRGADASVVGVIGTLVETSRPALAELEVEIRRRVGERDLAWTVSQDLQVILDRDGAIRAANRAWTTVLGWSADESIGKRLPEVTTRDPDAVVLDEAVPADGQSDDDALVLVRAPDAPDPFEACMRHRDGSTRWVSWLSTSQADVVHASGRHVTSEKDAGRALEQVQQRLRQAQKMEAFGQLTGGIAHDFNNLLQAVSGSLEMLGRKHVHKEDGHRLLRIGAQALDRASHLTRQLLMFARKQSLEIRPIDTNAAMSASVELAHRSLPENVAIEQRYLPGAWPVLGDVNQLDVAMLNLIINARDAMPDGGAIVVTTANVTVPGDDVPADLAPGSYVRLAVIDTGVGMPEDVRARVFEPFFTTKGIGRGTGLGLSQVYGFAHEAGGSVRITSAVGGGTTVEMYLPKADSAEAATTIESVRAVWRGRETVLVVDDDRDVRELAVACLQEYGYRVLEASSGVECLERLGQEASVDLLLIDFAMPAMNGAETVRLARRMRPELEVLFITGYADLRALSEHVGPNAILAKPFKLAQLAERVAQGLARVAAARARVA
jgi:PAS domain S-box-containing protein